MDKVKQSLLEQMRITEMDVERRKALLSFTQDDIEALESFRPTIERDVGELVDEFYRRQLAIPEVSLVVGDADTLRRLRAAQRQYILGLFCGVYDMEYVNDRLRIGLVHKRIGVEPRLYLSAVQLMKRLLSEKIGSVKLPDAEKDDITFALDKLMTFDVTLVFETYIRSLVAEIELSRLKSDEYAASLEMKVRERTQQLEELNRIDPLTGVYNRRYLNEVLAREVRAAQRRAEPISLIYIDVNEFKSINDRFGHQRGDETLRKIGEILRSVARNTDFCFRHGGDEFCILLPNCTEDNALSRFCRRFTETTAERLDGVTVSCGVAQTGPEEYIDPTALLSLADTKMFATKQTRVPSIPNSGPAAPPA